MSIEDINFHPTAMFGNLLRDHKFIDGAGVAFGNPGEGRCKCLELMHASEWDTHFENVVINSEWMKVVRVEAARESAVREFNTDWTFEEQKTRLASIRRLGQTRPRRQPRVIEPVTG